MGLSRKEKQENLYISRLGDTPTPLKLWKHKKADLRKARQQHSPSQDLKPASLVVEYLRESIIVFIKS